MQSDFQRLTNGATPMGGYPAPEPERDPLLDFALRWWWLLALGVLLGIAGAFVYLRVGPSLHSSTALVQVSAITGTDPTENATQARAAAPNFAAEGTSTRMYSLVSQEAAGTVDVTADELATKNRKGELVIRQQRGTNFIEITVFDELPERAQDIANVYATVMVTDINERSRAQNEARSEQLQQQIDFTRGQLAAAQLFERERELEGNLRDEQGRLLGLQSSYRQEAARQLELDQLTSGDTQNIDLEGARADFEAITVAQIKDVEQNIETIRQELADVQEQIANLPPDTDPLVETAFATAYSTQLASLTSQYAQEQIRALSASPPLTQFGDASAPVSARGIRTIGLMGVALGGALAAGLGFLIDHWRKRREESDQVLWTPATQPTSLDALMQELEQYQSSRLTGTTRPPRSHESDVRDTTSQRRRG